MILLNLFKLFPNAFPSLATKQQIGAIRSPNEKGGGRGQTSSKLLVRITCKKKRKKKVWGLNYTERIPVCRKSECHIKHFCINISVESLNYTRYLFHGSIIIRKA